MNPLIKTYSRLLICFFCFFTISQLIAQKGSFENIEVSSFEPPFSSLIIDYFGSELPLTINKKTKFKGDKKKSIKIEEVVEGTFIEKLSYKLEGEEYIALSIQTDISADGSIKVNGLFEGFRDDLAIVDGYPIRLLPGVPLKGKKNKNCECKGLLVPSFKSPLISPGNFYVKVQGKMDDNGVVNASSAELCRNGFGKPEQELLAAINNNLKNETNPLSNIPIELSSVNMNLYNGEVKVGQYSYKLTDDIKLQGYINQVGYRLLPQRAKEQQVEQGAVYYRFYVIEDPVPNAFAFPNGMIFIHTGLLDIIENEAQLAAVLGHEIAHVTHEHGRERYETNNIIGTTKDISSNLFGKKYFARRVESIAPGLSPSAINSIHEASQAITPEALSNIVKPQPKMESQADRVGLYYAYEAGYDIRESAKFWDKMSTLTGEQSFQSKITSDLINSLKSPRLNFQNGNFTASIGDVATNVLTKQILDTIYTSHPKAKKRARAVDKLVSSVYADTKWEDTKVKEEKYLEVVRE